MSDLLSKVFSGSQHSLAERLVYGFGALVLLLVVLAVKYPDRLVGTHPRKGVKAIPGALPILGNTLWIWKVATRQVKILHA